MENYPLCVNVFNKTDQCVNVEGEGSYIYAVDSFDSQAMVPADVVERADVFDARNCDIISGHNHREVMVDQVYKDAYFEGCDDTICNWSHSSIQNRKVQCN